MRLSVPGHKDLRKIVVLNPKGGCGKSTLTVNLAGYLASRGNSVAIMDFEEARHYYRIFDLGMTIVGTCSKNNTINFEKANSLLEGYSQKIELLEKEKKLFLIEMEKSLPKSATPDDQLELLISKADRLGSYLLTKHKGQELFNKQKITFN